MSIITPETSSSSRDDVVILTASQTLTFPREQGQEDTYKQPHPTGQQGGDNHFRDSITILGPFPPQTLELTSPDSSSSSWYSPRIHKAFTPIAVPIPRYEDCFESPSSGSGFNQLDYESSPTGLMDGSPGHGEYIEVYSSGKRSSLQASLPSIEPDHAQIVQERLQADDALFSKSLSSTAGLYRPRTPPTARQGYKKPRLAPVAVHIAPSSTQWTRGRAPFQHPGHAQKLGSMNIPMSYTIPQLRGLSLSDDSAPDDDDVCEACYKESSYRTMKRLAPCHHIVCGRCFSAALGSVSQDHPIASCPKCLIHVTGFAKTDSKTRRPLTDPLDHPINGSVATMTQGPIVMRIDNVAWDLTPEVVEQFLPPGTLSSDTAMAFHIPLDRYDGRTKDYMYIEVASGEAARTVLQTCQNTFMPGGPLTSDRKRAVTITQVPHAELLRELRPQSAREMQALLTLCQASVSAPTPANHTSSFVAANGIAHFVKNRHGPFHALMSILSKVKGKESPSYWDLFHVTSGAIAALASNISRLAHTTNSGNTGGGEGEKLLQADRNVLEKLAAIFETTFGVKLEHRRLSPV